MKHAYLILAHNEFGLLQTLICYLDDERNDIYVHIDRKVKELPTLKVEKANILWLKILHQYRNFKNKNSHL